MQTQDCNWRRAKSSVKRRRRDLAGIDEDDLSNEEEEFERNENGAEFRENITTQKSLTRTNETDSLSDNISLFQSIHVLQSKDEDSEYNDDTKAGKAVSC